MDIVFLRIFISRAELVLELFDLIDLILHQQYLLGLGIRVLLKQLLRSLLKLLVAVLLPRLLI